MRIRPDQGADERGSRRHDRRRGPAAGTDSQGADAPSRIGSRAGELDRSRAADVDRNGGPDDGSRWGSPADNRGSSAATRPGGQGSYWPGMGGGGAAGKGPVRGYPPMPGQPPPMYPPGQFAAWNRGQPGGAGPSAPGQAASRQPGQSGPHAAWQPQPQGNGPDSGLGAGGGAGPRGGVGPGASVGQGISRDGIPARYDDEDTGQGTEPSYPMLAVSDPSADVTSTQTWRAVEDGRTTGIWTAPANAGAGTPRRQARHGTGSRAGQDPGPLPGRGPRSPDSRSLPGRDQAAGEPPSARLDPVVGPAADLAARDRASGAAQTMPPRQSDPVRDSGDRRADGVPGGDRGRRAARGQHSGVRTGQGPAGTPESAPAGRAGRSRATATAPGIGAAATSAATDVTARPGTGRPGTARPGTGRPGTGRPGTGRPGTRRSGSKRRTSRPASVKLAITVAVVLVVAAAGALGYTVLRMVHKPGPAAGGKPAVTVTTPAASSSPSASSSSAPGPYGQISSRKADPVPLTVAQLFPHSFTAGGAKVTLVASRIGRSCSNAVDGSTLQARVSVDGCSQAVRATYVNASRGIMGTIGVLNISTANGAARAAKIADGSDFVAQVRTKHGSAHKIGQGTGIEESAAKGHYLILLWAEYTSLKKPKTTAQRNQVEAFMTQLLKQTANVSLTNRMLTGHP